MKLLHSPQAQTGGWVVLGNHSNLMNEGMNQTEGLPYEIMSSLVCPHSRGKSSFFFPFIIFFLFSQFGSFLGFPLFLFRPPLPCSLSSHMEGSLWGTEFLSAVSV